MFEVFVPIKPLMVNVAFVGNSWNESVAHTISCLVLHEWVSSTVWIELDSFLFTNYTVANLVTVVTVQFRVDVAVFDRT